MTKTGSISTSSIPGILAFFCFVLSGAASVSYETIWLRQAMTYFGVITPVLSCVLSVFMAGLGLGTWISGRLTARLSISATIRCYALLELAIGAYAFCVPDMFKTAFNMLLSVGQGESTLYLLCSCVAIALILLPVATLIGCTFPLLMHFLQGFRSERNNFGFLYCANLIGAMLGCLFPLVAIELLGFRQSILIIAGLNFLTTLCAWWASQYAPAGTDATAPQAEASGKPAITAYQAFALFSFGLVTMGSEIVWMKELTPVIAPTVYSFAMVLAVYLLSSAAGAQYYISRKEKEPKATSRILRLLPMSALLPVLLCSASVLSVYSIISLMLVCFCLGYLTPKTIDDVAQDNAHSAANVYLYNFAGCILGPLVTTYMLFPYLGMKGTLIAYAMLLLVVVSTLVGIKKAGPVLFAAILLPSLLLQDKEGMLAKKGVLFRDSIGYEGGMPAMAPSGPNKVLQVNGIGMTYLTTVTKMMAHLPLALHQQPKNALVICFGMGTTVRSLTSWPALEHITAVELSKGVTQAFSFFHDDAQRVLDDKRVQIVVDDGRRFLNYTTQKFDIVTIDPPPPIYASGSGLLYTDEFLAAIKSRLNKGGILQHWIFLPKSTPLYVVYANASVNSLKRSFKHIKIYNSLENIGYHVLASDEPLPDLTPEELVRKLPESAIADIMEWEKSTIQEVSVAALQLMQESVILLPEYANIFMSDDMLYNEFMMLRTLKVWNPVANPVPLF